MAGVDNLSMLSGSGFDGYTQGAGTAFDGFTAASGSGKDDLANRNFSLAAESGTLNQTPLDIDVDNGDIFDPDGATAILTSRANGTQTTITYTGVTGNTLKGCTIVSGSFAFATGDQIEAVP